MTTRSVADPTGGPSGRFRRRLSGKSSVVSSIAWMRGGDDRIIRNSVLLMISSGLMGAFGFAFWLVVARLHTAAEVGTASSLISAVNLIAYLSLLGLDVTVIRFAARSATGDALITISIGAVALTALGIGVSYAEAVPHYVPELAFAFDNVGFAGGFVVICICASVNLFTDSVFLAFRRPEFNVLVDGLLQGVFKVASPFALLALGAYGIVLATGIGYAVSVLASLFLMRKILAVRWVWRPERAALREVRGYSGAAYLANMLNIAPILLLPLIAVHALDEAQAGYFFIAFQIANLVNSISYAFAMATFSEGSHTAGALGALFGKSARVLAFLLLPIVALVALFSQPVLTLIGAEYASHATETLRLLMVGCLPVAISAMATQLLKLAGLMKIWIVINAVSSVVVVTIALLFGGRGTDWLAWAWIAGNTCAALLGVLLFVAWQQISTRRAVNDATSTDELQLAKGGEGA